MTSFKRFMAQRSKVFTITLAMLLVIAIMVVVVLLELSPKIPAMLAMLIAVIIVSAPVICASDFMTKAIKALDNDCDPYPLMNEAETQLAYKNMSDSYRFIAFMNNCLAFHSVGRTKDAIEFMEQVDVESGKGIHSNLKFLYYNNIACYCYEIGETEKGSKYLSIVKNLYEAEKNSKLKEIYSEYIASIESMAAYNNEEYDKAYELVKLLKNEKTKRSKVCNSIQRGKILLAMGKKEEAKKELQFVAQNGNKLHIAKEAADMLASIE